MEQHILISKKCVVYETAPLLQMAVRTFWWETGLQGWTTMRFEAGETKMMKFKVEENYISEVGVKSHYANVYTNNSDKEAKIFKETEVNNDTH